MANPTLGPTPMFPERSPNTYEVKQSPATPMQRGPLRFEEGVATDTDVPRDFALGAMQGYITPPGRINHNQNVYEKWPEETMQERAHVGSAAWVEAPTYLGEFVQGSFTDYSSVRYEEVIRNGARQSRLNPVVVYD